MLLSNKIDPKFTQLHNPSLELTDPNPDIHKLFNDFNRVFFGNTLGNVTIRYSKRMTECAGICRYNRGKVSIGLSEPLLAMRPRSDLINTILHEMIHAYIFIIDTFAIREGHGSTFCKHMRRINSLAGTTITIYHTFNQEVMSLKNHWWQCNGPCRRRSPFYGIVKRSTNRPPSKNDFWWAQHQATCGGTFIKIKTPENYGVKKQPAPKPALKGYSLNSPPKVHPKQEKISDYILKKPTTKTRLFTDETVPPKQTQSDVKYDFEDEIFGKDDDIFDSLGNVGFDIIYDEILSEEEYSDSVLQDKTETTISNFENTGENEIIYKEIDDIGLAIDSNENVKLELKTILSDESKPKFKNTKICFTSDEEEDLDDIILLDDEPDNEIYSGKDCAIFMVE